MRKKMLFLALALALAATATVTAPRAQALPPPFGGPRHSCPVCTTFPDGAQCCITCQCLADGTPFLCPDIACVPVSDL